MKNPLTIKIRDQEFPLLLKKSRRKSISVVINPNGELEVKYPLFISNCEVLKLLSNNSQWLNSIKTFSFINGSEIYLTGECYFIKLTKDIKHIETRDKYLLIPENRDIKSSLKQWYRRIAREFLTSLTAEYCSLLEISYNKIYIKAQKSLWGSCSSKKNINYNWKIILVPENLIRYLVIHEVCHLIEMNHSTRFWHLVCSLDKNYKIHQKELQKYSYYLTSYLE